MKKILLFSFTALLILASCGSKNTDNQTTFDKSNKPVAPKAEGSIRVLFVGNSHTEYFASFPEMLTALGKENGKDIEVLTLIEMGVGVDEILKANKTKADKMFAEVDADGNYIDYLILQESTPIVITDEELFTNNSTNIHSLISKNSPGVATYVYQLMSPFDYNNSDYKEYQKIINDNVDNVSKTLSNAAVLNFATVLASAYEGKEGYMAKVNDKDMLRHTDRSHHMLNDAVFLNSIVLYQNIFNETPIIPAQLPLATGTNENDKLVLMDVSQGVSNPKALANIAKSFQ